MRTYVIRCDRCEKQAPMPKEDLRPQDWCTVRVEAFDFGAFDNIVTSLDLCPSCTEDVYSEIENALAPRKPPEDVREAEAGEAVKIRANEHIFGYRRTRGG